MTPSFIYQCLTCSCPFCSFASKFPSQLTARIFPFGYVHSSSGSVYRPFGTAQPNEVISLSPGSMFGPSHSAFSTEMPPKKTLRRLLICLQRRRIIFVMHRASLALLVPNLYQPKCPNLGDRIAPEQIGLTA